MEKNRGRKGRYEDMRARGREGLEGLDKKKADKLCRITRGLIFASLESSQSGHPGGSLSKVEQLWALLLGGEIAFDFLDPKNRARDRMVWSAGHCTPLLYSILAVVYEALKKKGEIFDPKKISAVMPEDLLRFRHWDGPQGHVESYYPLADLATGSSGHGLSGAAGLALAHKSCGLDQIRTYVIMGDAETEEGMTYEARNIINTLGLENLIVSLDRNNFGIDGNTDEVVISDTRDHWLGLGWNLIEADGHDIVQMARAYDRARAGFKNGSPTAVFAHGCKGKCYGSLENTCESHGKPADHAEYAEIMKKIGYDVPAKEGDVKADIDIILRDLDEDLVDYLTGRLEANRKNLAPEKGSVSRMRKALKGRPIVNPLDIRRPESLPEELVFPTDGPVATRKATQAFFKWMMGETAFFWAGAGDLAKSILTWEAEQVWGILDRKNKYGRGIRFGIAEQNMAMMSSAMTQDALPGGFRPVSVFSSYGVFTSLMANSVRMSLIGNHVNPAAKGFFIMLAAHDGLETGEDGPTHHGVFWMSLYNAYPGIKVYKPLDANETVEMLFHAFEKGDPIALSVARPDTPIFDRGGEIPDAREAVNGAYVFKPHKMNGKKKAVLAVCGGQVMANLLETLPELEKSVDAKIVAVTSPELFEDLRERDPEKAEAIFSDEERDRTVALHNGWPGFLYPFLLPPGYRKRSVGVADFFKSGPPEEVYRLAGLDPESIKEKILKAIA